MRNLIRQYRDSRVDFFRGLALWSIFIDHLNRSWLRLITLKQLAFCDSAEVFVLLAGVSAGLVYGPIVKRHGIVSAWGKILRRTAILYRAHLITFLLFAAEAAILASRFHRPDFLPLFYFDPLVRHPYRSLIEAVALRWQPTYLDILPLYVVLLLMFCVAIPLLRKPALLMTLSILLYVGSRSFHLAMPLWEHPWYFNPFSWQLLFVVGVVSRSLLKRDNYGRGWDRLAIAVVLFGLIQSHSPQLLHYVPNRLLVDLNAVDKTGLHPFRLTSVLAISWLAWRYVPSSAAWLKSRWAGPFILMGQHSLPVFCSGLFVSLVGQFMMFENAGLLSQILVQGLGTLLLVGVAAFFAWNSGAPRLVSRTPEVQDTQAELDRVLMTA